MMKPTKSQGKPKTPPNTEERAKIVTMAADGASQNKIAQAVGRSRGMVKNILAEPEIQQQVRDEKDVLAEIYRSKARRIVESINDQDIAKASLQQKSISSGVLLDKSLLLTGDVPTFRIEVLLAAVAQVKEMRAVQSAEEMEAVRRRMAAESTALPATTKPA
jgi:predicted transcriptional regulator